jgi:hypothetical protein
MTPSRFTINEQRFGAWLDKVTGRDNDIELFDEFEITEDWNPMDLGDATVDNLASEAQRHDDQRPQIGGVIIAPGTWTVAFEYADDTDGGGYYWLVTLEGSHPLLRLASPVQQMRVLMLGRLAGRAAAESIVREAVQSANECLNALDGYVESQRRHATQLSDDHDAVQDLIAKARQAHARAEHFDDDVYDAASMQASGINNNGMDAQVEFLVEQLGAARVGELIELIERTHRTDMP